MKQQLIFMLIIVTTLFSCDNFSNKVKESVDNNIADAKTEWATNIVNIKDTLTQVYKKALQSSTDTNTTNNIKSLYLSISKTSKYIDSLKTEIDKLDAMDIKNIDLIKKIYLNDGVADSLFNKVKSSYTFALSTSLTDKTKASLTKARDSYTEDTKKQFFEMSDPFGVNMILYAIELELIKEGTKSLQDYANRTVSHK